MLGPQCEPGTAGSVLHHWETTWGRDTGHSLPAMHRTGDALKNCFFSYSVLPLPYLFSVVALCGRGIEKYVEHA